MHLRSGCGRAAGDARILGVLLKNLSLEGVAVNLADPCLVRGFYQVEQLGPQSVRWTDGAAVIRLVPADKERELEIMVAAQMHLALVA